MSQGKMNRATDFEDLNAIGERVTRLESGLEAVVGLLKDLSRQVKDLANNDKPQWGVVASWAGIVLTVVFAGATLISYIFDRNLTRVETRVEKVEERRYTERIDSAYRAGRVDEQLRALEREAFGEK